MTCNDIITSQKVQMKYAHTTTFTVMREGDRVHTFLGLAGMEWDAVVARRPGCNITNYS